MNPIRITQFDLKEFEGKSIRVKMKRPVKINRTEIEEADLIGYFHEAALASNPPHYPVFIRFVHESLSKNVNEKFHETETTPLRMLDMISIEIVKEANEADK